MPNVLRPPGRTWGHASILVPFQTMFYAEPRLHHAPLPKKSQMHIPTSLRVAVASACLLAMAAPAADAQPYPNRPIRIIEPFPAGGGGDVLLRAIAPKLTAVLGQPIVIDN